MKDFIAKNKGKSFAEVAKIIEKKYPNRSYDPLERRAYQTAMTKLISNQESMKLKQSYQNMKKQFKKGGTLKYQLGAVLGENPIDTTLANLENNQVILSSQTPKYSIPTPKYSTPTSKIRPLEVGALKTDPLPQASLTQQDDLTRFLPQSQKQSNEPGKLGQALSKVKDFVKNDADAPMVIGRGLQGLGNAIMLAGGPDKVNPNYNPYEQDVRRTMMNRSTDSTAQRNAILDARNAALASNSNFARSKNVQAAMDQNIAATTGNQMAQSMLQQDQLNETFAGQLASTLNTLGAQRAQAQTIAEDLSARNKGAYQTNMSQFLAGVGDTGEYMTKRKFNEQGQLMLTDILSNKYATFGITNQIMDNYLKGKDLDPEDKGRIERLFRIKGFDAEEVKQQYNNKG